MVDSPEQYGLRSRIGLILGPIVFIGMLLLSPPGEMPPAAWQTAAVAMLMAIWWITEAIPIPATALLPLMLFPFLDVLEIKAAAAPYANPVIFLFLGGFFIAQAMQRWNLHRRIALHIIAAVGTHPVRLVGGFMLAAAFLSMWVSNTATTVMMLPIGASVVERMVSGDVANQRSYANFATALMLGIAYACSIGGLGTLIGTPPNALLAGFMESNYGISIGFGQWMMLGVPLVAVGLPLTWLVLTRWVFPIRVDEAPAGHDAMQAELAQMGGMSRGEKVVAVVFVLTAAAWIFKPLLQGLVPQIHDAVIAITAALILFATPVDLRRGEFALNWDWARRIPWDVLILFGGGLSLASAISRTGLAASIGEALSVLSVLHLVVIVLVVVAVIIFLTELTSNTATAAAFLPIMGSLAVGLGYSPLQLAVPAALAASCAFMLPVATPPNAIVFGSGYVSMAQMARAGLVLNLIFTALLTFVGYAAVMALFGP